MRKVVSGILIILSFMMFGCVNDVSKFMDDIFLTEQPSSEIYTNESTKESVVENETKGLTEETDNINTSYGKLNVSGTKLKDDAGNVVQLKGISTHGIAWFPDYVNEQCFKELHENYGINVIRLAMYTAEYNGYCEGGDKMHYKNLLEMGVEYAANQNMYAIIDWHILSDSNPNTYIEEAEKFFKEMSRRCASYGNVIYEICNEPNNGTTWDEIKQYAQKIIPVIREYDKDAVIIVGTPNWSQYVDEVARSPLNGYDNIMYSFHFYAGTHKEDMRQKLQGAIDMGLPVFVSEFGICEASGNGEVDTNQADLWIDMLNSNDVSYVMWNLSNKDEASAIINPACSKVNGFSLEDFSESGKWFVDMMKK